MDDQEDVFVQHEFNVNSEQFPNDLQETCENTHTDITSLELTNEEHTGTKLKTSSSFGTADNDRERCLLCHTKVYPMEKIFADNKLYHKNCFRCSKCRTALAITNFHLVKDSLFCKTHFMERFKLRGKYDDDDENIHIEASAVNQVESENIPTTDTKSILAKFRELETGTGKSATVSNSTGRSHGEQRRYVLPSDDVVRSDDAAPDALPAPDTAKSMVAKFRAMENAKSVPTPENVHRMQLKAKVGSGANTNIRLQNPQADECIGLGDHVVDEELPEEGTTKNLLNMFQHLSESN